MKDIQLKKIFIFLLFVLFELHSQNKIENLKEGLEIRNISEVLKEVDVVLEPSYYQKVINGTKEWIGEYVFKDILKAPPQIEGYTDYFPKVDLTQELDDLYDSIGNETHFYQFYQKIYGIISKTRDLHISYYYKGHKECEQCSRIFSIYTLPPVTFEVKKVGEEVKVYALINQDAVLLGFLEDFKDFNATLVEEKYKSQIEVKSIRGMDPIEYLYQFGFKYSTLKNKNAQFTYNQYSYSLSVLCQLPLDEEELSNLTFVYADNETISTYFMGIELVSKNKNSKEENFLEFIKEINPLLKNNPRLPINKKEAWEKYFRKYPHKNIHKIPIGISNVEWDYISEDETFKCKVDNENQVNVYYQSSFITDDLSTQFLLALENCAKNFHQNSYPIVVIEDLNGGGYAVLSAMFQEYVQALFDSRSLYSVRNSEKYTEQILNSSELISAFWNEEEERYYTVSEIKEFLEDSITENYSENVTHKRTIQKLGEIAFKTEMLVYFKEQYLQNIKKPTEILIFTDGFSFSATSVFLKNLQNFGGAITVGYNGHPLSTASEFDSSQSPTFVFTGKEIIQEAIPAAKELYDLGFVLNQFSYGESFKDRYEGNNSEPQIPMEFTVNPVDERIDIFEPYNDNLYSTFIGEAKKIFEKYKEECNPNNKLLRNLNTTCDASFKPHTHGGNICGDDGRWTEQCEPFYCDREYYFDYNTKKCIKDDIYQQYKNEFYEEYVEYLIDLYLEEYELNEKLMKQVNDLLKENEELRNKTEILEKENEELKIENEELLNKTEILEKENEKLKVENEELLNKIDILEKENEKLLKENEELLNKTETLEKENEELKRENEELLNKIKKIEEEKDDLKKYQSTIKDTIYYIILPLAITLILLVIGGAITIVILSRKICCSLGKTNDNPLLDNKE